MTAERRQAAWGLGCGLVFAVGLQLSGMTDPARVLAFLDFAGDWDPRLAFVMVGAIGVHFTWLRLAARRERSAFSRAPHAPVTGSLLLGAAIFGVGWGMSGYCPGPALVASGSGRGAAAVFVAAMLAGMLLFRFSPRWGGAPERTRVGDDVPHGARR
jgi:uncharacterized membrane protein YedE/YeeE